MSKYLKELIRNWLSDALFFFVLPCVYVLYVDVTKCFPYSFARWLWTNTRYQNSPHVHDGFLFTIGFLLSGGIYYGLRIFLKKKK